MSILINENTRLLVQGITGHEGSLQTKEMLDFGTNVVGGVTPGKGGSMIHGVPVFNSVEEAVDNVFPNASVIFVPPDAAVDAIYEAVDGGIELIVCITEGIPVHDMMRIYEYMKNKSSRLIGPNCPGITSPGRSKIGIMPNKIHLPGKVGIVSRSGTLTYEVIDLLTKNRIGQSSSAGIGGDPVTGTSFLDVLELFEKDKDTHAVVMIGEIGGTAEEDAIDFIKQMSKPVIAYIVGITAPSDRTMGHAGAIVSMGRGTARSKIQAFEDAKIPLARDLNEIVKKINTIFK